MPAVQVSFTSQHSTFIIEYEGGGFEMVTIQSMHLRGQIEGNEMI